MKTSPNIRYNARRRLLLLLVSLFLFLVVPTAFAGIKTSVATGNWNTASTWSPAAVPTAADSVVIQPGHTVTLNANGTCGALTVLGTLNYSNNNNRTLTVTTTGSTHQADVTISGTFAFTANNGQILTLAGNFTCTGSFVNSTGNNGAIIFNGTGTKTITSTATLKSITVNNSALTLVAGGNLNLTTNLTVTAGSFHPNCNIITGSGTNTLTVTGTLLIDAATFSENYLSWETRTLNAGSTVVYTHVSPTIDAALPYRNLTFSGTGTAGSSGNLTIQGNLANTAGGTLNLGTNDVTISGTGASQTIAGFTTTGTLNCTKTAGTAALVDSVSVGSIVVNGSGGTLHLGDTLSHTVQGDVTILAGTMDAGTCTLNVEGNWTQNGTFVANASTLDLRGSSTGGILSASTLHNLRVNRPNGVSLSGDLTVSGNLILSTGQLIIADNTLTISGDITISGGSLVGGSTSNIVIGGSGARTTLPAVALDNLTINRNSGVDLGGNVAISGVATVTNGTLNTSTYTLILTPTGTVANAGSGRIEGTVTKNFLGVETGMYRLMSPDTYVDILSPGLTAVTIRSFSGQTLPEIPYSADTLRAVRERYYEIADVEGSGVVRLRVDYLSSEMGTAYTPYLGTLWRKPDLGQPWVDLSADSAGQFFVEKSGIGVSLLPGLYAIAEPGVLSFPVIAFSSTSVDFGNVPVGTGIQRAVTVYNLGTTGLTINQVSSSNSAFTVSPVSANIAPNDSAQFTFTFTPPAIGLETGIITFEHNASGSPHTVSVSGTGAAAVFAASVAEITFTQVPVGSTLSDSFWISNHGNVDLTISSFSSTDPHFGVNIANATVNPQDSVTVRVTFSPDSVRTYAGYIVLEHNGATSPDTVRVSGDAITNVPDKGTGVPLMFELHQNFPNPFNPRTTITFTVDAMGYAELVVYNIIGQEVATLFSGTAEPSKLYTIDFDASAFTSGVYFYHLVGGDKSQVRKMMLIK